MELREKYKLLPSNVHTTSTPLTRVTDASGNVTGGFDSMLSELLEVVRAQETDS